MSNLDRHRHRPQVEALEALVPLSGAAGVHSAAAVAALAPIVQRQGQTTVLQGTVRGAYVLNNLNPDTGTTYHIGVAGRINPLGETGDSGSIQTTGLIASGNARGTMTIAAPKGSLKLTLTGPVQPGLSTLPSTVSYTITGGTRSYRTATGGGTIAVTLSSSVFSNSFGLVTLRFQGGTTTST